jgi:hypothetical protein
LEQAEKAGLLARSDAWKKHPSDMLYWRAVSRIISQVYPDVIQGFATVEEIEEEQPVQQATAVAMPTPIEEPKPKRQRKVKAAAPVTAEPELMAEEIAEEPIMPDPELANAPMPDPVPAIQETPLPQPKPMSRPYYRYIKQVMLEGGVRYLVGINPLNQAEDKLVISSAGLASELKKLTGMQVGLLLENGQIIAYEQLGA